MRNTHVCQRHFFLKRERHDYPHAALEIGEGVLPDSHTSINQLGRSRSPYLSFKELFAGLVSCALWDKKWWGSRMQWLCDNQAVVHTNKTMSCSDPLPLFLEAWFGFQLVAAHFLRRENMLADVLSRDRLGPITGAATCSCIVKTGCLLSEWGVFYTIATGD